MSQLSDKIKETSLSRPKLILVSFATLCVLFLFLPTPFAVSAFSFEFPATTPNVPDVLIHAPITLTSPNAQLAGYFAFSVATSSKFVVVGAPYENANGVSEAGRAYIYNATNASLMCNFTTPNPTDVGGFGFSVSMSGDLVVIGAIGEYANGQAGAGHAYVFNAMTCKLLNTLTSSNPQYAGNFGTSVAISGKTVAVGAPGESAGGYSLAGNAYEFNAITGALIHNFTSPNPAQYGMFGYSVTVDTKYLIVGAPYESFEGGRAYIFSPSSGALIQTLSDPSKKVEEFGTDVALSGKLLIVGADSFINLSAPGHAYVFSINNSDATLRFTFSDPKHDKQNGLFGWSVSMSGNFAVVSAPYQYAKGNIQAGETYVFNLKTSALVAELTSPNAQKDGWFGYWVSITGNLLAVGAPQETANGHGHAGHAYIYYLD